MQKLETISRLTSELSEAEISSICALFQTVFGKVKERSHFLSEFSDTCLGHSFHTLLVSEGTIVGVYSAIPYRYRFFDREVLFALSVDTMIHPNFRGLEGLKNIARTTYNTLKEAGIAFVFGFPNDNIYVIRKRFLGWQDVGMLNFHIHPVNLGTLAKKRWLNPAGKIFSALLSFSAKLTGTQKTSSENHITQLRDSNFWKHRLNFFQADYRHIFLPSGTNFIFRMAEQDGLRVVYILQVIPNANSGFSETIQWLAKNQGKGADAFLYIGNINNRIPGLIRIPRRFEPKKEYMSGKILDTDKIDNRVFDISNWNVDLITLDVV